MKFAQILTVCVSVASSSSFTPEFADIKARIFRGEDTVFDVATRDFRVLIFMRRGAVNDTIPLDTTIINRITDKESQWKDESWLNYL